MQRRRVVPAAPVRSASETWNVIEGLLRGVLFTSPHLDRAEVDTALSAAARVGRMLIAGGHLDAEPVILVAPPVHLTIQTVSGDAALSAEEPDAVLGGATITEWTLHLPAPDPLGEVVRDVTSAQRHLSDHMPPADATVSVNSTLDRAALRARLEEGKR